MKWILALFICSSSHWFRFSSNVITCSPSHQSVIYVIPSQTDDFPSSGEFPSFKSNMSVKWVVISVSCWVIFYHNLCRNDRRNIVTFLLCLFLINFFFLKKNSHFTCCYWWDQSSFYSIIYVKEIIKWKMMINPSGRFFLSEFMECVLSHGPLQHACVPPYQTI